MTQSFDELFWNRFDTLNKDTDLAYNFGSESYNEGYKAGAASRQAEIDALSALGEMSEQNIDDLVLRNIELQKRIDTLSKKVNEMAHILLDDLEETLKGESE